MFGIFAFNFWTINEITQAYYKRILPPLANHVLQLSQVNRQVLVIVNNLKSPHYSLFSSVSSVQICG